MNIKEMDQKYIANTYGRFDLVLTQGKGSVMADDQGKSYIDLGTGIAVNAFGISDEAWMAAVETQLYQLPHTSNLYYTEPQVKLAKMLCEKTGMEKVFFGNSGAEANECAIKVARKYAHDIRKDENPVIVTLKNSFHGRTVTTLAATGQDNFHQHFGPFTPGFIYVDPDDFSQMEKALSDPHACAVLMEMVQGEGGIHVLDQSFVKNTAALCKEKGVLLMIDEVQTGNGRTGQLYAYMHYDVQPDVVTTAKGLGGGLPIGACMMRGEAAQVLQAGHHGSTFGGNPVCAAGALSIISRLDEMLFAQVREKNAYIVNALIGAPGIKGITGLGLMLGLETVKPAKQVVSLCQEKGVLVLTAKEKVRLLPALNIPMELLVKAVMIIKEVAAQ